MADEREIVFQQKLHALVRGFGAREDEAVGHAVANDVPDRIYLRRVEEMRRDHEMIGRAAQGFGEAADHGCRIAEDFFMRIEHQADDIGSARSAALGGAVGQDRNSVAWGKCEAVRVVLGGVLIRNNKKKRYIPSNTVTPEAIPNT